VSSSLVQTPLYFLQELHSSSPASFFSSLDKDITLNCGSPPNVAALSSVQAALAALQASQMSLNQVKKDDFMMKKGLGIMFHYISYQPWMLRLFWAKLMCPPKTFSMHLLLETISPIAFASLTYKPLCCNNIRIYKDKFKTWLCCSHSPHMHKPQEFCCRLKSRYIYKICVTDYVTFQI